LTLLGTFLNFQLYIYLAVIYFITLFTSTFLGARSAHARNRQVVVWSGGAFARQSTARQPAGHCVLGSTPLEAFARAAGGVQRFGAVRREPSQELELDAQLRRGRSGRFVPELHGVRRRRWRCGLGRLDARRQRNRRDR